MVKAVVLDMSEAVLDERRRHGLDVFDEVWEGVLHMVPPPSSHHQGFSGRLFRTLAQLAEAEGLAAFFETGLYRADDDYRVPDQVYASPRLVADRGVDGGASLVVEIRSPRDETDVKVGWYAALGVETVLVVDPLSRRFDLYVTRAARPVLVQPDAAGEVAIDALGVRLSVVDGPRLLLTWPGGTATL